MIITLTPKQRKAVDQLLAERRLEAVPIDRPKAAAFLQNAREAVEDLANLTRPQTRYTLAYDAAHDVGEALLAACGYRTKSGAVSTTLWAHFYERSWTLHPATKPLVDSTGFVVRAIGPATPRSPSARRKHTELYRRHTH